jgi:hypothetical protein
MAMKRRVQLLFTMVALALGSTALAACEPDPNAPLYLANTPLASWRVNGDGLATVLVGDVVYVGGEFSLATSPNGAQQVARANLAAFDANTGALLTTFRADTNGAVRSLAHDGTRLYVGGSFTRVNGISRYRLAALNPATGAVDTTWRPEADSNVYSIALGGDRLFVGGSLSSINGVGRNRVAALDRATGNLTGWAPNPNAAVNAIAASATGDRIYIGGSFSSVNGASRPFVAALDAAGALVPVPWAGVAGAAIDLEVSPDGTRLAMAQAGDGNRTSWHNTTTGARLWFQRCEGDMQATTVVGGTMLSGGHEGIEDDFSLRLTANATADGERDQEFRPTFDKFWGVYALAGDRKRLVAAGDFTLVSGVAVQGFAIFPTRPAPPPPPVNLQGSATWAYLDTGIAPPPEWTTAAYDDAAWARGPAQLGYGDGDEATVVSFGPSASSKYMTTWFRTTFLALGPVETLTLRLLADDGAVVYVNGTEVVRDNMPAGPITPTTRASSNRSGSDETTVRSFALPPSVVQVGNNVIAVEVHQDSRSSSDLSFLASLTATPPPPTP